MVKKHKKVGAAKQTPPSRFLPLILSGVIVAVVIIAALIFFPQPDVEQSQEDIIIVAMVNDEPILLSDLDRQWYSMPPQSRLDMERDDLLEQLIEERLLMQEANRLNLTVSQQEVETLFQTQLMQAGVTEEQAAQSLLAQGMSVDDLKSMYFRQLSIARLFEETVEEQIDVSTPEIVSFYEENRELFFSEQMVTVRHILLEESVNASRTQELIDTILERLETEDFCDLVDEFSMDAGSVDNCGEYTFPREVMVPEFEEASFRLQPEQQEVVQSEFGFHIIRKISDRPEGYLDLSDRMIHINGEPTVRQFIEQVLLQEKASDIYTVYVQDLSSRASITRYMDVSGFDME